MPSRRLESISSAPGQPPSPTIPAYARQAPLHLQIPPPRSYRHLHGRQTEQKQEPLRAPKPGHQSSETASSRLAEYPELRFCAARTSYNSRRYPPTVPTPQLSRATRDSKPPTCS